MLSSTANYALPPRTVDRMIICVCDLHVLFSRPCIQHVVDERRGSTRLGNHSTTKAFHFVIPGYMVHGVDITHGIGTGGESIYRPSFSDENFMKKRIGPSILSKAKTGIRGNGSQFFNYTSKAE
ncbi:hypothetical protein Ddye_005023 [Dipteronia dyeriana]|uniref:Peptidyl-prolyl cis-trans isomerase n=1 Tax=Dipteronia dyeriana TaxID=168575 RepID=A0AAD9XFQ7_9ROSI|nr:hypothetical protein Ddye_005023 [Dipteronia dyeriana]